MKSWERHVTNRHGEHTGETSLFDDRRATGGGGLTPSANGAAAGPDAPVGLREPLVFRIVGDEAPARSSTLAALCSGHDVLALHEVDILRGGEAAARSAREALRKAAKTRPLLVLHLTWKDTRELDIVRTVAAGVVRRAGLTLVLVDPLGRPLPGILRALPITVLEVHRRPLEHGRRAAVRLRRRRPLEADQGAAVPPEPEFYVLPIDFPVDLPVVEVPVVEVPVVDEVDDADQTAAEQGPDEVVEELGPDDLEAAEPPPAPLAGAAEAADEAGAAEAAGTVVAGLRVQVAIPIVEPDGEAVIGPVIEPGTDRPGSRRPGEAPLRRERRARRSGRAAEDALARVVRSGW